MDQVKLTVSGDLLFHEEKKVYAALLTTHVVFHPGNGKPPLVLSTRTHVMAVKSYLDLVKDQPDKIKTMNNALDQIMAECSTAKCDTQAFMCMDTSKKPHWKHIRDDGRHFALCSECNCIQCKCEPGKGAPPSENPHTQASAVQCWLPAFE